MQTAFQENATMASDIPPTQDEMTTVASMALVVSPLPTGTYTLTVVDGPDVGMRFAFDGTQPSPVLVGQGPICDFRLTDHQVSRRHLQLEHIGKRLRITDLQSKNGTFVDGVAIVEAFLCGGEFIRIGATAVEVQHQPGAPITLPLATSFGRYLGASTEIRRLYPLLERIAQSEVPVVIEGETGTGKEVLAEALHERGPRASMPFVVFDCTAVPSNLVESELFGHERGAFTGAHTARQGVFEQAHGGTLLIDEIGDLDISLQPKLLRAIDRRQVRRVGGNHAIDVDVRIMAATRRDLDREVQENRFRDDLFHRIAVARVQLPPLRRRCGDVSILANHFCQLLGGKHSLHPSLLRRWEDFSWPGNVRQLRNAVARVLALGELAEAGLDEASYEPETAAITPGIRFFVEQSLEHGTPLDGGEEATGQRLRTPLHRVDSGGSWG